MYAGHSVGVVVPAYNEAGLVGDVIDEMPDYVDRLYLVDDASTDRTWAAIREAAARRAGDFSADESAEPVTTDGHGGTVMTEQSGETVASAGSDGSGLVTAPSVSTGEPASTGPSSNGAGSAGPASNGQIDPRAEQTDGRHTEQVASRLSTAETIGEVICLRHAENRGAGGAIKTGYLAAIDDGVDIVATVDADGQMNCGTLSELLDPLVADEADYAKGNRFHDTEVLRNMPPFRLTGNLLLTGLTRIASGYWGLRDPQNGFTATTRETLVEADVGTLWTYYGYMNQLMGRFNTNGVRIADVPMETIYDKEESSIEYGPYIRKVSLLLLRTFFLRLVTKRGIGARTTTACYLGGVFTVGASLLAVVRGDDGGVDGWGTLVGVLAFLVGLVVDAVTPPGVVRWENR